ncbi:MULTISPECIES: hypothetical protein [Thermoactinomyces]|jgi:hypothetical protein|uniref:Uncharacterized protein n=1 Tax=Thermoactinomyces daqus TaxID=1329516 RepID=A0A7W2AJ49_9BACL|nr:MULTISPECIES: hypothetical protein [Thermoactinomyces]MBA4543583.1 hypothetical protein [Thermoactinomyces daqus]MBH8596555.1 hypothetical protein [Thermoactinomyces sp. CICC 10523]MBH8603316.1 hypothetical protein [Thermoactinomyces sp. CICC 10522]MBH8607916.1 hypothetical protein [Thermoactinomyces sp. CICC 10521]
MPVLLFSIALVLILVHAVVTAIQILQAPKQNWFEFVYQLAIAVAALWFLLQQL